MKKLLSMKKIIFIATMFLISVSANSQIIDVEEEPGNFNFIKITNAKGEKISVQTWPVVGWTKSYILTKSDDNCNLDVINSKGETIKTLYFASSGAGGDCPPNLHIKVTPNYFSLIRFNNEIEKYNNKGERIW